MKRKAFEAELRRLQAELVALQEWVVSTGTRICVLFEGRDAAGKGGVDPAPHRARQPPRLPGGRTPAPTERERSQLYMQRYIPHLPARARS